MDAFELLERAGQVGPADPAVLEKAAADLLAHCGKTARGEPGRLASLPSHPRGVLFRRALVLPAACGLAVACAAALVTVAWIPGRALHGATAPENKRSATEERPLGALTGRPARPFLLAMAVKAARAPRVAGRYWCTQNIITELVPVGAGGLELTPPGQGLPASPASGYRYSIIDRQRTADCQEPANPGSGTVAGWYQELGAKPATPKDAAAWRRARSPRWRAWYGDGQAILIPRRAGPRQKTGPKRGQAPWGSDASLPASPAKLRAVLLAHPVSFNRDPNENLFNAARLLLLDPVRPAVRAAAFRVLASIPGIQMKPGAKDPDGRGGTALWLSRARGSLTSVTIVDPATGTLLADEWLAGRPAWVYAPGTVTQYTVWLSAGWANQLPPASRNWPQR